MTNAERIKGMSADELAVFMWHFKWSHNVFNLVDWLKAEVVDG